MIEENVVHFNCDRCDLYLVPRERVRWKICGVSMEELRCLTNRRKKFSIPVCRTLKSPSSRLPGNWIVSVKPNVARSKSATIEGPACHRAVLIDGTAVIGKHGTAALLVIAEHDRTGRKEWRRKEQLTWNMSQRASLRGDDVDEP